MIKSKNFQKTPIADIPKDTEYRECNFSRQKCIDVGGVKKGIRLFPGDDTPRTFIGCNLVNCEPPPNSVLQSCNTTIRESQVHVGGEDVEIDSATIEVKEYADIIYGRYKDGQYEYKPIPTQIPCKPPEVL